MKIFNELEEITDIENTVVALGNFDGVHIGHRELIIRAKESAKIAGMKSAVFTFSNHPKNLMSAGKVKNILYPEQKIKIMESFGVDYLFNIPFTEEICHMNPTDYVDKILIEKFKMKEVYCGFNYRFGYKAEGNTQLLMNLSLSREFGIHVMEPYKVGDQVVSSTLIRSLIKSGKLESCKNFLGRNYSIGGTVVVGKQNGRKFGFPTCNIVIDNTMITPPNGVYVTFCNIEDRRYPSITNVGVKPTIGVFDKNIETHIFDIDENLYGKYINVEFLKKIRDEIKFDSVEDLKKQISDDCIKVKAFHRRNRGEV